ncbi:MAG: hypothetical protein IPJ19_10905 [Planctomycetes bacterium]|nr:hypothetical protein [Planctomycetota bacterium]
MRNLGLSALAALAMLLPACTGGGNTASNGSIGNSMFILTCSLGCPSGAGGQEVHCTPISIAPNQEFVVTFSQPVDPTSVSSETFSIIDTFSGATPLGTRLVDPVDSRRVIFRPAISFDFQGNPTFGFSSGASYSIVIKGTTQDPTGPYIRSVGGKSNSSRMSCQMATTSTPIDYVPGAPSVTVKVDLAHAPGDPVSQWQNFDGEDATDVWTQSTVRLIFDDIMNPVTLANQATHQSTFVTIKVDVDGDLSTTVDQITLSGLYVVTVDLANLTTVLTFTSSSGMPSSGDPLVNPLPRLVVVNFPSAIQDLAGNGLSNAGSIHFTPEFTAHDAVTLPDIDGENFNDTIYDQSSISAGTWGNGRLTRGFGGGSGRLGEIRIRQGAPVDLSTDSQVFPLDATVYPAAVVTRDLLDNSIPVVDYDPADPQSWPTITVTNGIFEFSSLTIEPGASLKFHGTHPARVLVRGPVQIQGNSTIDVTGSSADSQDSSVLTGSSGAAGGPNAGSGGDGADRFNNAAFPSLLTVGGVANPGSDINGAPGGGVGQVAGLGAAHGGTVFPLSNFPTSNVAPPAVSGGLAYTYDELHFSLLSGCISMQAGAAGGGGTYGDGTLVSGGAGTGNSPQLLTGLGDSNLPPNTLPGAGIPIEPPDPASGHFVRKLDADIGNLRGGAGGGGGGCSLFGTSTPELFAPCANGGQMIGADGYQDNSGAGGGGGGGALQLVSGSAILLDGVIDARGGNGGSGSTTVTTDRKKQAAPGGGGTGGAVRLQAPLVSLAPVAGRINITGGAGGITDMNHRTGQIGGGSAANSIGGAGSSGLVRIEDSTGLLTRATEAPWVLPFDPTHLHAGSGLPESEDFLSVGNWSLPRKRPESFSASTSCWMQPAESFFVLSFDADDLLNADPALRYGWNMDVIYNSGSGEQLIHYRGPDPNLPFPSGDFQSNLGNTLNHGLAAGQGSYFAIRFQGAKSKSSVAGHPCDVNLYGAASDIVTGSLTPWVRHPADLNQFSPHPDMIRYTLVFDNALVTPGSIGSFIKGVTNLKIRTQPD